MRAAIMSGQRHIRPYLVLRIDREDLINSAITSLALYEVGLGCGGGVCGGSSGGVDRLVVLGLPFFRSNTHTHHNATQHPKLTCLCLHTHITQPYDLKKKLKVQFTNEEGVDEG